MFVDFKYISEFNTLTDGPKRPQYPTTPNASGGSKSRGFSILTNRRKHGGMPRPSGSLSRTMPLFLTSKESFCNVWLNVKEITERYVELG